MAVNLIGNQLVKLYSVEDFNERNKRLTWDTRTYCQVVREEQITMFQVQVTPQTDDELISNWDFDDSPIALPDWNIIAGDWISDNGMAVGMSAGTGVAIISQNVVLEADAYYIIEFDVSDFDRFGTHVTVSIIPTPDYDNFAAITVNTEGTHVFYFYSEQSITADIFIAIDGTIRPRASIDFISMKKLSTPTVTVEDCEGVTKRTLVPFAREQDYINYSVEWFGLPFGCYRICITEIDDLNYNYLNIALAIGDENGAPILDEEGGIIKWMG